MGIFLGIAAVITLALLGGWFRALFGMTIVFGMVCAGMLGVLYLLAQLF